MSSVHFYLFETRDERQAFSACRLCRKILRQHPTQKIWFFIQDLAQQQNIDALLWSFDETSFIGHGIDEISSPVCLSAQLPPSSDWIVFNFNPDAITQFSQFHRIIEIIENNEMAKQFGREKFKQYRQLGIKPTTYKL